MNKLNSHIINIIYNFLGNKIKLSQLKKYNNIDFYIKPFYFYTFNY